MELLFSKQTECHNDQTDTVRHSILFEESAAPFHAPIGKQGRPYQLEKLAQPDENIGFLTEGEARRGSGVNFFTGRRSYGFPPTRE